MKQIELLIILGLAIQITAFDPSRSPDESWRHLQVPFNYERDCLIPPSVSNKKKCLALKVEREKRWTSSTSTSNSSPSIGYSFPSSSTISLTSGVPPTSEYQAYYNYMNNQALDGGDHMAAGSYHDRRRQKFKWMGGDRESYAAHYPSNEVIGGPPGVRLWERVKAVLSLGGKSLPEFFQEYQIDLLVDLLYSFFKWLLFFYISLFIYH